MPEKNFRLITIFWLPRVYRLKSEFPMTWADIVFERLKANGLEVVCHVPDSVLAPLITRAESDPFFTMVALTREEEGMGGLTPLTLSYPD